MTSLAAEITRVKGPKKPAEVTELILDKCSASKLAGDELSDFTNLETLSLNNVGLSSLENFPSLPKLKRLELSDNKISGGLDALQDAGLFSLRVLNLSGNRIQSLDDLEPLGSLPNLKQLDLFNCAVTEADNYRDSVFEMIPALKLLDGANRDGHEVDLEDELDDEGEGEDDEEGEDEDDVEEEEIDDDEGEEDDEDEDDEEVRQRARRRALPRPAPCLTPPRPSAGPPPRGAPQDEEDGDDDGGDDDGGDDDAEGDGEEDDFGEEDEGGEEEGEGGDDDDDDEGEEGDDDGLDEDDDEEGEEEDDDDGAEGATKRARVG